MWPKATCTKAVTIGDNSVQHQRYEIALSREHWTLDDWRLVIFLDETSVIVSAKRGQQNISQFSDERYHKDCIESGFQNRSPSYGDDDDEVHLRRRRIALQAAT
jgi:hypothetical protein